MAVRFTRNRLILYSSITILYLIFWVHTDLAATPGKFAASLVNSIWQAVYVVGLNLSYFEIALPLITSGKTNRAIAILSSVIAHLIVFAIGLYAWRNLGTLLNIYHPLRDFTDPFSRAVIFTPGAFLLFAAIKLFTDYAQLKYEGQKIRLEKKQAELLFLKSQINPHFLFNTLNNIYSLSEHQPELVSESVLRLSKILRYLLYETGNELTTIDKEVGILTDYIDLEKLRYNETVSIAFTSEIDYSSELLPPLLIIPLVENAFKHGVSLSRGKRFVEVTCALRRHKLHVVVRNSVPLTSGTSDVAQGDPERKNSIGLSNLRRRLELLYKNFELLTELKDSVFTAELRIDLSSHV